jgi:hypothetical protein
MPTTCKYISGRQVFDGNAQVVAGGCISSNQQVANTTNEVALLSETVLANELDGSDIHFRVTLAGEISSTGTGDCTLTLRYGSTDILALTTVSLADEDDKQWRAVIEGRIHTTGASGKIVATGRMNIEQGTALLVVNDTAAAGASVDLTVDGSLNVTAQWDAASTDNDIIAMIGFIEFYR